MTQKSLGDNTSLVSPPVEHDGPFVGAAPQRIDPKKRRALLESHRQYLFSLMQAEREER